jgi:glycosyltransferase involved in cell wall biosynthesis
MDTQSQLIAQAKAKCKLAQVWHLKGNLDRAISGYQEVINLLPRYSQPYYYLGCLFLQQNKLDEAIAIFEQALKISPEITEIHKNLIYCLTIRDGLSSAFNYYQLTPKKVQKIDVNKGDILLISCVRNESLRLPYFLKYYRAKGIDKFFIIDNNSTDDTLNYLLQQPDVYPWYSPLSYKQANFGSAWVELLLRKYAIDHWCLVVDADEIFYYPYCENKNIHQLCEILDQHYKKACPAILLDMYSNQKIKDTYYQKEQDCLEVCPYFDKKFCHTTKTYDPPYNNQIGYLGGLRERVFGGKGKYHLSKVPLIKYSLDVTLSSGQHFVNCPFSEIANMRGALLHFKYFSSFIEYATIEAERKEHAQDGLEYQGYAQKLRENPDLNLYDPQLSLKLENSQQLVELEIMKMGEIAPNYPPLIASKKTDSQQSPHILIYTDCSGFFGVEQWNNSLIKALVKSGYQVSCVQKETSNYLIKEREEIGVKHFWLENDTFFSEIKAMRHRTNTSEPCKIFDLAKPDLIIFSNGDPLSNLAAQKVASEQKIPFLQIIHRVVSTLTNEEKLYLEYLPPIYQECQEIITVSQENLDLLHNLFNLPKNKGKVIYSGKAKQYFEPLNPETRVKIRRELNIPLDAVVCFTAARFNNEKGYQYQLSAMEQLKKSEVWEKLYFVWAGRGLLLSKLQTIASQLNVTDKIRFLEKRTDIPDLLDAADIFVLPSQYEGMPLAIMEAMAKGKPVIASAVSGIPEELGDTGKLLADPNINPQVTIQELVETIEKWTLNAELRHNIGKACKKRAEKMFQEERMYCEYLSLIEAILGEKNICLNL